MTKTSKAFLLLILMPAIAALVAVAVIAVDWNQRYKGFNGELLLDVPKGMGAGKVLDILVEKGVARNRLSLKLAYTLKGKPATIKAGRYRFNSPQTPLEVLQKLLKGDVVLLKVSIPEGLRMDEVSMLLANAGLGSQANYSRLFSDPSQILDLDPEATSLEGYLFPDSYLVDPSTKEDAMAGILVQAFRKWWKQEGGGSEGRDPHNAVVLASIVEKESSEDSERPLIAGVFLNRIRIGMPLQSDPTVVYALVEEGLYGGRLSHEDMCFQSPYNTYVVRGLPPGPICSPGRSAMAAALRPVRSDYLYFVSRNDGTHTFSRNLQEHNRAVSIYRQKVQKDGLLGKKPARQ